MFNEIPGHARNDESSSQQKRGLLALTEAEAGDAVEGAEVFGFDEVESGVVDPVEEGDDVGSAYRGVAGESATPVIGALGFGVSIGPHFEAPV